MVLFEFNPHPATDKSLLLKWALFTHAVKDQFVLGDGDAFQLAGIGEIDTECPPNKQHVEPRETGNGPGTKYDEHYGDDEVHSTHQPHENEEAVSAETAVWCQRCLPDFAIAIIHPAVLPQVKQGNTGHMAKASRLKPPEVEEMFRRFQAANPEPKGELHFVNPYTLLVAVVLSAQATDEGVNKATKPLFAIADTPQKMVALGEDTVRDAIKTIGLFRGKARNVILLSQQLINSHDGQVPDDRDALEALPGVGRKTANVVLNIAFGHPTIAVDTHLFRLGNRTGLAPGKTPLDVELKLLKVVPKAYGRHAHHWLILHGRYVCKARRPECWHCLIADICTFRPKTPAPI